MLQYLDRYYVLEIRNPSLAAMQTIHHRLAGSRASNKNFYPPCLPIIFQFLLVDIYKYGMLTMLFNSLIPNPLSATKLLAQNTSPTLQGGIIVGAVETFSAINTLVIQSLLIKMPITTQRVLKAAPANTAGTSIEAGLLHDPVDPTAKVLRTNLELLLLQSSIVSEVELLTISSANN